ncbi:uncharacterized protein LOC120344587 [Styela clava]
MYIHPANDEESTTLGCGTALSKIALPGSKKKGLYDISTGLLSDDSSGSSLSLCSEKSFNSRKQNNGSSLERDFSSLLDGVKGPISALARESLVSSSSEDLCSVDSNSLDLISSPILMSRIPRSKNIGDSGRFVQTRRNAEIKASELYYKRNSVGKISFGGDSDDQSKKNNALGSLMAWFQRKSSTDSNSDPSPFKRSASLHCTTSTRTSRKARSELIDDKKDKMSDSDENDVLTRRNSFSSGRRRSFKRRSSRRGKRSIDDENTKPELTLDEMMKSKVALQAFREFLILEHSEENLDFWLDCEIYKSLKSAKQTKMAFKIFSQYLARSAPREVNIDFETRARTEEKLKNPDNGTFIEPQNCIYNLMKCDTFRRFVNSDICMKLSSFICNEKIVETRKKFNFKTTSKKTKLPR